MNYFALYPKQFDALYSPARYSVIEGATKSGKTSGCLLWLLDQAFKKPGEYWWVAPIYPQADIAFERAVNALPLSTYHNKQSKLIRVRDGHVLRFKSADNPQGLYGQDVEAVVLDEASRMAEAAWVAIRSTLTKTQGPARIIGNVQGRSNWHYRMARRAEQGEEDMDYHILTAWDAVDAGILAREEIEDAQRTLSEEDFKELYECVPKDSAGNPFNLKSLRECIAPISDKEPVVFGVDLAKGTDYTCIVGLDANGYVCKFHSWKDRTWAQTEQRILDVVGTIPTLIDSTGVGDPIVERLNKVRRNINGFKFSMQSKQQLMEGLASAIQNHRIHYPYGKIVQELEIFEYTEIATGVRYSAPQGQHDDSVMALALAWKQFVDRPSKAGFFAAPN